MKEIRTKLDIYFDMKKLPPEVKTWDEKDQLEFVFGEITELLEGYGLSYQIYEQEIQEC